MSAVIASGKRDLIVGVMRLWSGIGGIRMAENKMDQIAKMYGKELGEEFKVKCGQEFMDAMSIAEEKEEQKEE
jgi:hypothetical protein